jgi:hypothetical protein
MPHICPFADNSAKASSVITRSSVIKETNKKGILEQYWVLNKVSRNIPTYMSASHSNPSIGMQQPKIPEDSPSPIEAFGTSHISIRITIFISLE